MLRSFDYALEASLLQRKKEDQDRLKPWALGWLDLVSSAFLDGYRSAAAGASFLPPTDEEFDALLKIFLLDKAIYEIGYELNYRPDFLPIPLSAINRMVDGSEPSGNARPKSAK
jgi:maltose alpha-D-glucosyltransferase/alpha-amylase